MDRVRDLVAAGGVSVVLAQDRDRFAREPAYHYLLRKEFEEHDCVLQALNDHGDDSPEGQLTDGILDQIAKFERAKIAERTRRGRLRRAREGKVVPSRRPNFGFRYNSTRNNYVVDEKEMRIVERIFYMVGVERMTIRGVKRTFEREGTPSPAGKRNWAERFIRRCILDDIYKAHSFEEVEPLVFAEVAARLDSEKKYGVWWFNRERITYTQVAEDGPDGKRYRRRAKYAPKPGLPMDSSTHA
jgi:site-specific DNA recombinase